MVLTLEQVQQLTTQMRTEILESPAFLGDELLAKYGIRVITGIEFKDLQYAIKRQGGSSRAYKKGSSVNNTAGKVTEAELVVKVAWNRYIDNIEDYREKEPFHVATDGSGRYVAPASEVKIRAIGANFTEDCLANVFYGIRSDENAYKGLSLYDGILKKLSAVLSNVKVIETGAFAAVTEDTKTANWDAFVAFVAGLPAAHQKAMRAGGKGVKILCSPKTKALIVESYTRTFPSLSPIAVNDVSLGFIQWGDKLSLVGCELLGEGSLLMAVVDGTLDYGVDSLNNKNHVEVGRDTNDFSNIIFEIKAAMGTRVIDESKVALNEQANTFTLSDYCGDYTDSDDDITMQFDAENGIAVYEPEDDDDEEGETFTLTVTSADTSKGTVTGGGTYASGTEVEIKATALEGYVFEKWNDNDTNATRTVTVSGDATYTASFKTQGE